MSRRTLPTVLAFAVLASVLPPVTSAQQAAPSPSASAPIRTTASSPAYQRFLSPASPLELVAAKKVDRIAWTSFEEGKRNAYTAAGPAFTPVRLTNFMTDNGIDLSGIRISDDGSTVIFMRGTAPNRDGWVANPTADPDGPERAVWAARTAGGPAFRVAVDAANPELAPDGSSILFVRAGQIHRARSGLRPPPPRRAKRRARKTSRSSRSGACRADRSGRRTAAGSRSSARAPITASS